MTSTPTSASKTVRPRRRHLAAAMGLVAGLVLAGCGDPASSSAGTPASGGVAADVTVDKCTWLAKAEAVSAHLTDRPTATLAVVNHSSKARDYQITVAFNSADGKTQYDTADTSVATLEAGQTGTAVAISLGDNPGPLSSSGHGPGGDSGTPVPITCKVIKIDHRHF